MPLFETYIFVDWSARNALTSKNPSKDSIWVGEFSPDSNELDEYYFRGRRDGVVLNKLRITEIHLPQVQET